LLFFFVSFLFCFFPFLSFLLFPFSCSFVFFFISFLRFSPSIEMEASFIVKFQGHSRRTLACVIGMDDQFSITSTDLSFVPF
jgi:hypothetical protein